MTDTLHTPAPICPYCGHVERDAWEINLGPGTEGDGETDCGSCGRTMFISRFCSITYSTAPLERRKVKRSDAASNTSQPKEQS